MSNHIKNVAIVGAGGHLGKHLVEELQKTNKHTITALTRAGGTTNLPTSITVKEVDYNNEASLISALTGQDALIITLAVAAPPDTHSKIVRTAIKAGVKWILPNMFGIDIYHSKLATEAFPGIPFMKNINEIVDLGGNYVSNVCGFWYEWSVALGDPWFGIDLRTRKAVFVDDGLARINVSTWRQCGRAVAALLSLPIEGERPCLMDWKNKPLYYSSFKVSQRDILDSINRVCGSTDADWEITHEPSMERWEAGMKARGEGDHLAFVKVMYTRNFFPDGSGDYEVREILANDALGLPKEDLDEATQRTLDLVKDGFGFRPAAGR